MSGHTALYLWLRCVSCPNLISWTTKKQQTVSRFSAEAEYRSLAHACAESTWIMQLLRDLQFSPLLPATLFCDNLSATYIASNPVFHTRTKHIELDYHFIRERIASGTHWVQFVPSTDQLADIFTKGLSKQRFRSLQFNLVSPGQPSLRGSVRTIVKETVNPFT